MPKPATLGSEELLGYGLRPTNLLMLDTDLSIRFAETVWSSEGRRATDISILSPRSCVRLKQGRLARRTVLAAGQPQGSRTPLRAGSLDGFQLGKGVA